MTTSPVANVVQGLKPGWYSSAELYDRYAGQTAEPMSKIMFGISLRSLGYLSRNRAVAGKLTRSWLIGTVPSGQTYLEPSSPVCPLVHLTAANLKRVLDDAGWRLPDWYRTDDLYAWYEGLVQEDGLVPVSRRMFGNELVQLGYRQENRWGDSRDERARWVLLPRRAGKG